MSLARTGLILLVIVLGTAAILFLVHGLQVDSQEADVVPSELQLVEDSPARNAAPEAQENEPFSLLQPGTHAQLRDLLRYCREADKSALPQLRKMALDAADPLVAGNAIRALGRLHAVARDSEILELLGDRRLRVRQELVIALGDSGDARVVKSLSPLLRNRDPALRPLVLQALGKLGGRRARRHLRAVLQDPKSTDVERVFARTALSFPR